jgi:apolipoprotein D and lipocalin family protein
MKRFESTFRGLSLLSVALGVTVHLFGCSPNEPLAVAKDVSLERFQGQWFEIAKLPRIAETNCTRTTAFYRLRDGGLDVENQCHVDKVDGPLRTQSMRATIAESTSQLTLSVSGFTGDYWILEVGEHYEYAVIGVPSRNYLWILSRTPTMDKSELDGLVARAKDKKFDTSRLEYTVQTAE